MIALALLALQQTAPPEQPIPYWQQDVAYEISARLDEPTGVLAGTELIRYRNNSPDTLTTFSLHLYLNAFRPGSRWAEADLREGRRRFNDLPDPHFAFNHVRDVRIMGQAAEPLYPFAPDSTIVRFALPRALAPGDSMTVEMNWDARPSTLPRRQGRQGRRFDFAQWYPKVVVYDRRGWAEMPLHPAGEFYGEFGSFVVDLDVPRDQVVGATGVPVCGDPGWERANRAPSRPVDHQRNYYGAATPSAGACEDAGPGRKRIRWYAERVHHFAFSLNPEYRYEGGRFGAVAIHVLYFPGDEATWGNGIAVERTRRALAWLDGLFGPFGWPQLTNLHRIEGGGTEFPMVIMNGSADQGLIVHEAGHNYVMGLLANNEWHDGWLDEGFTTFQSTWFWEVMGRPSSYPRNEAAVLLLDLEGESEPSSQPAHTYRDFTSYGVAINTRGELFFHQLRHIVGDETMHRILRTFYQRWKYKHVDGAALQLTAEEVSGRDLSTLFAQWLETIELYDYAVGEVRTERAGGQGGTGAEEQVWITRVEVVRKEAGRTPVDVAVIAEGDTAVARAEGDAHREWVQLVTLTRPRQVLLDPAVRSHDWNMLNNRRSLRSSLLPRALVPPPGTELYFHPYFSTRVRRDRLTVGVHPTLWYNEAGGITLGVRSRDDYLGRFEQNVTLISASTGWSVADDVRDVDFFLRARNPVFLRAANTSQTLEVYNVEGRVGAAARLEWSRREHLGYGPRWSAGVGLQWVQPDDFRYLDPGLYEDVGTVELQLTGEVTTETGRWRLGLETGVGGGLAYNADGLDAGGRADLDPFYFRGTVAATAHTALADRLGLAARAYVGVAGGEDEAAKQRQIYFQGADPLEQFGNPFLRSRGALLVGDDFRYHAPGGAGVRGVDPRVSTAAIVALNVELERTVLARPEAGLFNRVGIAAFADLGQAIGGSVEPLNGERIRLLGDAGIGVRAEHRIGDTRFATRFDLPLYVSRPEAAQDRA
ncbi:MAG: M1 family metallopeptidase, partial [Gemmatimonadales bacterium]|nr:M1 family metallopeptidase [Gemmatimonadales bacterium]